MKRTLRFSQLIIILCIVLCTLILLAICIGSVKVDLTTVASALFGKVENTQQYIIRSIRLPRVLGSVLCGAMLGLCGVVFQAVFRNPMADPYLLGVSSGASLAVAAGTLAGITSGFLPSIPLLAFAGAMGASVLVMAISHNSQRTLILSGVALSSLFSAITTLIVYLHRHELSSVLFWTMGSFSSMSMNKVLIMAAAAAASFAIIVPRARALDLLLLDEGSARSLGLNVEKTRILMLGAATICTAAAVCFCGVIGFAGLLAPHIARALCGPEHRKLIPTTALVGAIVLLAADTAARTIAGSAEIPVGVITSILGAPLFVSLASRKGNTI